MIVSALTVFARTTSLRKEMRRDQADMTVGQTPIRVPRATPAARAVALAAATAVALASAPACAQRGGGGPPIIRDAEIEQLLREYTQPLLRAAGLAQQNIQIVIINDRAFNAFVADGRRIFVNAGAVMEAKTPNEITGVLAHESAHIAGGHLARIREQLAAASTQAILAMILGVGAMVAGSRTPGMGEAGAAMLSGPQAAIQNTLFAYIRAQEDQADRAAVKFLTATGQSPKGMSDTFKRLADQVLYHTRYMDPYMQSHPMPSERVAALEGIARASPYWDKKDPPALQARHDLMRAKLFGFMDRPDTAARRYAVGDASLPARYARAISTYRFGDPRAAIAQIDALIHAQPQNPYFHELKGQALLESGKPAEAIAPLRHAAQLAPNPLLIRLMLAQALVATHDRARTEEAIGLLQAIVIREPELTDAYSQLAMAYGQKGDLAHADLASAQAAFTRGDIRTARELAARARTRFPVGSPGWVKADDIYSYKPPQTVFRRN
jgi:predicted Zn-dependent protease